MKISALVPIYGVEKYIERCARSLFEQTYPDLEYVFVNDCSPDQSMDILKRVMDDYPSRKSSVRIIGHEKNRGLAAARKTAYGAATGEFVTMVDADDWMELNAIELLVKKQAETGADVVSGNACFHYSDRVEIIEQPTTLSKKEIVLEKLGNGWQNVIWGRIIRRSVIEAHHIEGIECCDMGEDKYQMVQICYYADSFATVGEIVYNYERRNDHSIVAQQSKDKLLKKALQSLQNNIGLQKFFSDKEVFYYEEASKQTMLYAYEVLKMMVRFNKKQHFPFVVATIDNTESKFYHLIGWSAEGLRGFLLHRYGFVWMWLTGKRVSRFLRRNVSLRKVYVN
jgi:glycosyltransferase involved in cell wall biosynthesis